MAYRNNDDRRAGLRGRALACLETWAADCGMDEIAEFCLYARNDGQAADPEALWINLGLADDVPSRAPDADSPEDQRNRSFRRGLPHGEIERETPTQDAPPATKMLITRDELRAQCIVSMSGDDAVARRWARTTQNVLDALDMMERLAKEGSEAVKAAKAWRQMADVLVKALISIDPTRDEDAAAIGQALQLYTQATKED